MSYDAPSQVVRTTQEDKRENARKRRRQRFTAIYVLPISPRQMRRKAMRLFKKQNRTKGKGPRQQ